jgi:competence protein ComEC
VFVVLPFAMICGMIVYAQLPFEPDGFALAAVAAALLPAIIVSRNSPALTGSVLFASFWLGLCLLPLHGWAFGTTMLARPAYGAFQAKVDEIISSTPEGQRVVVSELVAATGERSLDIKRARVLVPSQPQLQPGDKISGAFRFVPVPGPVLPGTFDGQFQSYFSGIGAYGSLTSEFILVAPAQGFDLMRSIEHLRTTIGARIDSVLTGSSAAIGRAMVMGDQSAISDETRDLMAASGLAHVYSISGLHLSIVAGGMFWLVRLLLASIPWFAVRLPVKKLAACSGLIASGGYMLLAGGLANVPALRSAIMLALIFGAVLFGRRALTMRNVAIAAVLIILIDPASVFRPSFQLSFAAVVALIGVYEMPRRPLKSDRSWPVRAATAIWATGATSFIAGAATLLFSAYHFQQTAPLGVLGNLLVLPVVSLVIMPFALLSVVAMPFSLEALSLAVMGWGIDRMVDGASLVANWSQGLTGNPLLTGTALVIGLAGLAWFAFLDNWWRLLGPAVTIPLVLLMGLDQRPDILVADSTQAVAMRSGDEMGLVTGKPGSFAVDVWSEHYQQAIEAGVPGMRCDSLGCIAQTEQYSIAVVKNAAAFEEDCGQHDLVITRLRKPATCQNKQAIDADDLSRGGVHWLVWNEAAARFDIRTAIPDLTRPWRVLPR